MLSVSQCPVRTKRHEAATLQRDVEGIPEFPDQNCSQCSCRTCRTLKMRQSGLTWFKFSMELQQWPFETYKHIIHTQNPFLSVTVTGGWCLCHFVSVTFVARCHEDGAPLATGDLASAGLCGISSASLKILKASEVEAEGGTLAIASIAILTHVDLDIS